MNPAWLCVVAVALSCMVWGTGAIPARRSPLPDLAARRRSATDRTFIRFGRSPYPEMSAAEFNDIKNSNHMRYTRARQDNIIRLGRSDSFLRFGRSQPLKLINEDILDLVQSYDPEEYGDEMRFTKRRANNFVRLGRRDNNFLRLGRSAELYADPGFEINGELMLTHNVPERRKDSHIRLGRSGDSWDLNEDTEETQTGDSRKKRAAEELCKDCTEIMTS